MMHFRRVYVGERRTRPLVLINNGYFPVQVKGNKGATPTNATLPYGLSR